jgi:hypothetical protein
MIAGWERRQPYWAIRLAMALDDSTKHWAID